MLAADMQLALERYYGDKVKLTPEASVIFQRKLSRFTPEQRAMIYEKLLETCKFFPRIADIFSVATDLGYLATEPEQSVIHTWRPTDCKLCRGEGRIAVFFQWFYRKDENGLRDERRRTRILPYASLDAQNYQAEHPDEYCSLGRCSCPAGDAETLPRGWPKWNSEASQSHPKPYTPNPDRQDFRRAGSVAEEEMPF